MNDSQNVIVVGSGRSGTKWFAEVLGIPHERAFTPRRAVFESVGRGESSLFAVPHLERLHDLGFYIIHEVRDPRDCIPSLAADHVFDPENPQPESPYVGFCRTHLPEAFELKTAIGRAARWWLEWNRRAQRWADETVRIEHLAPVDGYRWERIAGLTGVIDRMKRIPKDTNTRPDLEKPKLGRLSKPVVELATEYGYRL